MADILKIAFVGDDFKGNKQLLKSLLQNNDNIQFFAFNYNDTVNESCWVKYDAVFYVQDVINKQNVQKWLGHHHFRFIHQSNDLSSMLYIATQELNVLINDIEIEKKLLIKIPSIEQLSKYPIYKSYIEQAYLLCDNGSHRIRKRQYANTTICFETVKHRINDFKCVEHERIISIDEYNNLMKLKNPNKNIICKDRYNLLYNRQLLELDIYSFWNDKATIEFELYSDNQQFILPPEISLIKDVTNDYKYKNNYLAGLKL